MTRDMDLIRTILLEVEIVVEMCRMGVKGLFARSAT